MVFSMLSLRSGLVYHKVLPMLSKNLSCRLPKDMSKVSVLTHGYHSMSQSPVRLCSAHYPLILRFRTKTKDAKAESKDTAKGKKDGTQVRAVDRIPTNDSPLMQILHEKEKPFSELTTGEKVVRVGSDAGYSMVVVVGILLTGAIGLALFREVLSTQSPTAIYKQALEMVKDNSEATVALGSPIKAYGETSGRGRRNHMSHIEYEKDGVKHMRMKFYVEGPAVKGTVQLEVQKVDGRYAFRYIVVTAGYPPRTIIVEDNRASINTPLPVYEDTTDISKV